MLLGPGPTNPYPEATAALAQPLLGHLDPAFLAMLDETCDRRRTVYRTENRPTLPLSATGSAGMEAAFVNTVGPGDVVVVGVNGLFGVRMCDVAARCGADVVRVDAGVGEFASTVWRIGLMGPNARPAVVTMILGALGEILGHN